MTKRNKDFEKLIGSKIIKITRDDFGDIDIFLKTSNSEDMQISMNSNEFGIYNCWLNFASTEENIEIYEENRP